MAVLRCVLLFALVDIFPISFYGRNARERLAAVWHSLKESLSTFLNVLTVTILTITVALVWSLYAGATGWIEDNINKNPLARRITFGKGTGEGSKSKSGGGVDSSVFVAADLAWLQSDLAQKRGGNFAVTGVWGWNDVQLWFRTFSGEKDRRAYTSGRTVSPGDPLLGHLQVLPWRDTGGKAPSFEGTGEGQIIITKKLLEHLGYDEARLAQEKFRVAIFYQADLGLGDKDERGTTQNFEFLDVRGVCATLPYGDYLITDTFSRMCRTETWNPTKMYAAAHVGPLPRSKDKDPSAAVQSWTDYFKRQQVTSNLGNRADGNTWLSIYRAPSQPWSEPEWRTQILEGVLRRFKEAGMDSDSFRMEFDAPLQPRGSSKPFDGYINASIDVRSVEEVPDAVDALYSEGFKVKESVKDQAIMFVQISTFGRWVFWAVILIVGLLSSISIGLSFYQAVQRKTPEIGIFKAFGAGDKLVLSIYLIEAFVIWLAGSLIGFSFVSMLAKGANVALLNILAATQNSVVSADGGDIVRLSWTIIWLTGVISLVLCWLATVLGASMAAKLQPAQALKAQV